MTDPTKQNDRRVAAELRRHNLWREKLQEDALIDVGRKRERLRAAQRELREARLAGAVIDPFVEQNFKNALVDAWDAQIMAGIA